ncbi:FAD-binding protein [Paeniglutamicibacter antarcticus]|uniref:L-aspartate oxidase n=1 Tax=Arthrobacter terrae TaxID=2935737 RepID=A0A931CMS7_9MICC|nr:FAD-binding protein [Arthrobacter terrae]
METGTAAPLRLIIVGSGIAGLYGAVLAADGGAAVTLLTKGVLSQSNTGFAQGGISAVLGAGEAAPGDSVEAHIADTLEAGAGHCDPAAVRVLCTEANGDIARLESLGLVFDTDASSGARALGLEAAHSAARILHVGGDATGAAISSTLIDAVLSRAGGAGPGPDGQASPRPGDAGTITVLEHAFMMELTTTTRVNGVRYLWEEAEHRMEADAVLLATGGSGEMFENTTNPDVATGDGLAAAWRAGAVVKDAEFFQFHPTALVVPGSFMISEAVRGAGAVLRDDSGYRFMPDYHADAELAPRDVVARSIALHLSVTGAGTEGCVYLDATGVEAEQGAGYLAARFPGIDAAVRRFGFDWTREFLPVLPAAHYWMGGVATDLHGRTSLPGLFAAGEVACTGVHGANRLASNSLLEGLVFARRSVTAVLTDSSDETGPDAEFRSYPGCDPESLPAVHALPPLRALQAEVRPLPIFDVLDLRRLMSSCAGVLRDGTGLELAAKQLDSWMAASDSKPEIAAQAGQPDQKDLERRNLLTAAGLLVAAARRRSGSLGAHYRSDSFEQQPVVQACRPTIARIKESSSS